MSEPDQLEASLDNLYKTGYRAGYLAALDAAAKVCEERDAAMVGEFDVTGDSGALHMSAMASQCKRRILALKGDI